MATIVTRAGKGAPLTNTEVDANFTNLNVALDGKQASGSYQPAGNYPTGSGTVSGANTGDQTASSLGLGASSSVQHASLGVGTAASGVSGEIRATNNITASYSDERFKTHLGNIPDALAKVLALNGFYYEANELAQSYGYEKKREVGVSAQQVQQVQPEAVAPAPVDDQYLTVRYERLVPLLIEAIKSLNSKVEDLLKSNKSEPAKIQHQSGE